MFIRKAAIPNTRVQGSFRPETVNLEERTMEIVFTTGQSGRRYDFYNDVEYLEELEVTPDAVRTDRLDKGLSVIDNHDTFRGVDGVFGITEDYRFENGTLIGTARFGADEDSDKKFTKAADGILRHVSLGYKVHKFQKFRGMNGDLDTYRAVDWEPTELSFTPVSFETTNGVRAEQRKLNDVEIEEFIMTPEQLARLRALQGSATRTADEDKELIKLLEMQTRAAAPVIDPTPAPAAPVARAIEPVPAPVVPSINVADVRSSERGQLSPMIEAAQKAGIQQDFAIRAFNEGKSIDEFRTMVIDELGNKDSTQIVSVAGTALNSDERADQKETLINDAVSSLLHRTGSNIELTNGIRQFSGMTLLDMGRDFVEASGINTRGMSRQAIAQRAFHTTSDFPVILENVMNKNLQSAYQETPQTFKDLGRRSTVNDFREKHVISMGDAPNLLPLGEHGEYKAGTFGEGKEKYSIATYARKIGVTRESLINDDMSALDRLPAMFGAAGSRLESNIVWGLLLGFDFFKNIPAVHLMNDGKTLYHADHGNLLTGGGSVFGETALSDLRMLGRQAKTLDGNYMNINFNNLVLPYELETAAEKLLVQNFNPVTSATTNPFQGKFQSRVEPRLSAVSTTAWYAFSNEADTFEYSYLAGEEEMMTEVNTHTDVDGMEVKVRKDFGAGLIDYRAMAKSDGA